jgi:hypothetical protein
LREKDRLGGDSKQLHSFVSISHFLKFVPKSPNGTAKEVMTAIKINTALYFPRLENQAIFTSYALPGNNLEVLL